MNNELPPENQAPNVLPLRRKPGRPAKNKDTEAGQDGPPKPKAITKPEIFEYLSAVINGLPNVPWFAKDAPFTDKFFITSSGEDRVILRSDDAEVVRYAQEEEVAVALTQYLSRYALGTVFHLSPRDIGQAVLHWKRVSPCMDVAPASVRFKDDPGFCFSRLPIVKDSSASLADSPTFAELVGRMENADATCAWIGSLFFPESYLQQYLWIYGEGMDGKGSLARVLKRVLGPGAVALTAPEGEGAKRFFNSDIIGKRLGIFADCNNTHFINTQLFKTITGGDWIKVEHKGEKSFSIMPFIKFMYLSNGKPNISSEKNSTRRVLYCPIQPSDAEEDPTYEARLWDEREGFLAHCVATYRGMCPTHGPIRSTKKDLIDELIEINEERFSGIFERRFIKDASSQITAGQLIQVLDFEFPRNQIEQNQFRAFLERRRGVSRLRTMAGRFYKGLGIKNLGCIYDRGGAS